MRKPEFVRVSTRACTDEKESIGDRTLPVQDLVFSMVSMGFTRGAMAVPEVVSSTAKKAV